METTDDPAKKHEGEACEMSYEEDPFISDREVYTGPTPPDLAENHDKHLYGEGD